MSKVESQEQGEWSEIELRKVWINGFSGIMKAMEALERFTKGIKKT